MNRKFIIFVLESNNDNRAGDCIDDRIKVMVEKIRAYVEKYHMLEQSDIVVAGISGGADSVCLLFVLMDLQKEIGFQIRTVHVHHGLRGEAADADAAFVKELTEQHKIPCTIYYYDVELESEKTETIYRRGRERGAPGSISKRAGAVWRNENCAGSSQR